MMLCLGMTGMDSCSVSASSPSKLLERERRARAPSGLFQSLTFFGFSFLGVSCFIFIFGAGIDWVGYGWLRGKRFIFTLYTKEQK